MRHLGQLSLLLLVGSVVLGCPKELPPGLPADELYRIGLEKFESRDWNGTIEAMQRYVFRDPGAARVDSAQLLTGEAYFNQKQYLTAAAEFMRLAQSRPAGPLADASRFRACAATALPTAQPLMAPGLSTHLHPVRPFQVSHRPRQRQDQ